MRQNEGEIKRTNLSKKRIGSEVSGRRDYRYSSRMDGNVPRSEVDPSAPAIDDYITPKKSSPDDNSLSFPTTTTVPNSVRS